MERWSVVAFGPPALEALGAAVDAAKAGDPLAPVTVAAPSTYAGLAARRALSKQSRGLVNCRFVTLARVAELLGGPVLAEAGRLPLCDAVHAEAVRAALATSHGSIASVAAHPRALRSLTSTLAALRERPAHALDRIAGASARAAEVVRLYRAAQARLRGYYDEHDVLGAAADAIRARASGLGDVGHVVLYLPRRLSAAELDLCAALAEVGLLSAVLGVTGNPSVDQATLMLADRLASLLGPGHWAAPTAPVIADRVISAPDPAEEVRAAIGELMTWLRRDGLALHRAAILYPTPSPYAVILAEELAAAGIPRNGSGSRTLAQTAAGRCLRALADLAGTDLDRRSVMAWLSGGPILERPHGGIVPTARWERLARRAGIVKGDWSTPLKRLDAGEDATRLAAFVEELASRLDTDGLGSWRGFERWAGGLLDRYLARGVGGEAPLPQKTSWPQEERDAAHRVHAALERLAGLDVVGAEAPDLDVFRQAVARALEAPVSRHGRVSTGVFVGGLVDAFGMDFDVVVVLGMAEGLASPVQTENLLAPELAQTRQVDHQRDYLVALAAARHERVLTFPRSDPRAGRARQPSRWLLETAARHAGRMVYAEDLATLEAWWYQRIPSFAGGLESLEPASPRDWDLASLASWSGDLADHPLVAGDPSLARGIAAQRARAGQDFSVWDGHVGCHPSLAVRGGAPVSPSALQGYAVCGMRYLLQRVLDVQAVPEEAVEVSPRDRGALVHDVLDRFGRGEGPLEVLAAQACERSAETGSARLWAAEQERILALLARFPAEDERLRAQLRTEQGEIGVPFDIAVALPGGGSVTVRGRIDRLDGAPDGSCAVVIDYKTGQSQPYRRALSDDPVAGGQLLALPVYGLAARARLGDGEIPVRAAYWFLQDLDEFELVALDLDDEVLHRFTEALAVIVAGIEAGRFPARHGALATSSLASCDRCPYDLVCPADRVRAWERKRHAPELASYVRLVER
jgi:ATP-dependent helicase/nuclease subunit B